MHADCISRSDALKPTIRSSECLVDQLARSMHHGARESIFRPAVRAAWCASRSVPWTRRQPSVGRHVHFKISTPALCPTTAPPCSNSADPKFAPVVSRSARNETPRMYKPTASTGSSIDDEEADLAAVLAAAPLQIAVPGPSSPDAAVTPAPKVLPGGKMQVGTMVFEGGEWRSANRDEEENEMAEFDAIVTGPSASEGGSSISPAGAGSPRRASASAGQRIGQRADSGTDAQSRSNSGRSLVPDPSNVSSAAPSPLAAAEARDRDGSAQPPKPSAAVMPGREHEDWGDDQDDDGAMVVEGGGAGRSPLSLPKASANSQPFDAVVHHGGAAKPRVHTSAMQTITLADMQRIASGLKQKLGGQQQSQATAANGGANDEGMSSAATVLSAVEDDDGFPDISPRVLAAAVESLEHAGALGAAARRHHRAGTDVSRASAATTGSLLETASGTGPSPATTASAPPSSSAASILPITGVCLPMEPCVECTEANLPVCVSRERCKPEAITAAALAALASTGFRNGNDDEDMGADDEEDELISDHDDQSKRAMEASKPSPELQQRQHQHPRPVLVMEQPPRDLHDGDQQRRQQTQQQGNCAAGSEEDWDGAGAHKQFLSPPGTPVDGRSGSRSPDVIIHDAERDDSERRHVQQPLGVLPGRAGGTVVPRTLSTVGIEGAHGAASSSASGAATAYPVVEHTSSGAASTEPAQVIARGAGMHGAPASTAQHQYPPKLSSIGSREAPSASKQQPQKLPQVPPRATASPFEITDDLRAAFEASEEEHNRVLHGWMQRPPSPAWINTSPATSASKRAAAAIGINSVDSTSASAGDASVEAAAPASLTSLVSPTATHATQTASLASTESRPLSIVSDVGGSGSGGRPRSAGAGSVVGSSASSAGAHPSALSGTSADRRSRADSGGSAAGSGHSVAPGVRALMTAAGIGVDNRSYPGRGGVGVGVHGGHHHHYPTQPPGPIKAVHFTPNTSNVNRGGFAPAASSLIPASNTMRGASPSKGITSTSGVGPPASLVAAAAVGAGGVPVLRHSTSGPPTMTAPAAPAAMSPAAASPAATAHAFGDAIPASASAGAPSPITRPPPPTKGAWVSTKTTPRSPAQSKPQQQLQGAQKPAFGTSSGPRLAFGRGSPTVKQQAQSVSAVSPARRTAAGSAGAPAAVGSGSAFVRTDQSARPVIPLAGISPGGRALSRAGHGHSYSMSQPRISFGYGVAPHAADHQDAGAIYVTTKSASGGHRRDRSRDLVTSAATGLNDQQYAASRYPIRAAGDTATARALLSQGTHQQQSVVSPSRATPSASRGTGAAPSSAVPSPTWSLHNQPGPLPTAPFTPPRVTSSSAAAATASPTKAQPGGSNSPSVAHLRRRFEGSSGNSPATSAGQKVAGSGRERSGTGGSSASAVTSGSYSSGSLTSRSASPFAVGGISNIIPLITQNLTSNLPVGSGRKVDASTLSAIEQLRSRLSAHKLTGAGTGGAAAGTGGSTGATSSSESHVAAPGTGAAGRLDASQHPALILHTTSAGDTGDDTHD